MVVSSAYSPNRRLPGIFCGATVALRTRRTWRELCSAYSSGEGSFFVHSKRTMLVLRDSPWEPRASNGFPPPRADHFRGLTLIKTIILPDVFIQLPMCRGKVPFREEDARPPTFGKRDKSTFRRDSVGSTLVVDAHQGRAGGEHARAADDVATKLFR